MPGLVKKALGEDNFRSGLHAACHALLHVVPLYVLVFCFFLFCPLHCRL